MKYDEFKQKVEGLSSKYEVTKTHSSVYVQYEGTAISFVDDAKQFRLSANFKNSLPFSHKLYMIMSEYAMTPISERHRAKQYVFPIWTNFLKETWYLMDDIRKTTSDKGKALKFSQEKIDKVNKAFTFNLNDIKQEVTDD